MANRRRNLIILVLVLALLGGLGVRDQRQADRARASTCAAAPSSSTRAGRRRRCPRSPPEDIDRAIEIIRERVDTLGVAEPEITRIGADQIEVALPDVQDADRAIEQIGTTAQLFFYDFEPNVIPPNPTSPTRRSAPTTGSSTRSRPRRSRSRSPRSSARSRAAPTNGADLLPLRRRHARAARRALEMREDLFVAVRRRAAAEPRVIEVPQGTVVLEEPPDDDPSTEDVDESEAPDSQFFVLHDRPALSGDEIENPEQNSDPTTNQPNVTFDFTDEGREAFQKVTERDRPARRRRRASRPGSARARRSTPTPPTQFSEQLRDRARRRDPVSRPIINFDENPTGIDGRTGAQISGTSRLQEAQDLAEVLRIGALPIKLALISQSTVSATLGEQALDQGLKAGLAGLAIVLLFLIAYYRFLGVIAGLGLLVYAVFFLALIKLIPITLTLPGIAGPDPDDRRRGRLQHRHLRADQGGGQGRALDALGDLRGLQEGDRDDHRRERDHPDHGVHPLRARERRGQGLRVHARDRDDRLAVHRRALHPGGARRARPLAVPALAELPRRRRRGAAVELRLHRRLAVLLLGLRA